MSTKQEDGNKRLVSNRKAFHDYHIVERFEAGIALVGCEVKSLRAGQANMQDSYANVRHGQLQLLNLHISPYEQGNRENPDEPTRPRILLMHRREILKIEIKLAQKGFTLIPLSVYLKGRHVKVELGLAKGKHTYDKKASLKERDIKRDTERELRQR